MLTTNKKVHPNHGRIVKNIKRVKPHVVEAYKNFYTGIVLDHMGKQGVMDSSLLPLSPNMKICGPAVTSLGPDLSVRRVAIDLAEPGDVLVVAAGGNTDYASFGDGTAKRMQLKGIQGAVIDGAVRDSTGIHDLNFPTFTKAITPRNYHYPISGAFGGVNVPVTCAGVSVNAGDLVLGDGDGVIVVPSEIAEELIHPISKALEEEKELRRSWGEIYQPFDLLQELITKGYKVE